MGSKVLALRLIQMNRGPAYMYASVKKIEVVDPLTVKFVLKSPFAPCVLDNWVRGLQVILIEQGQPASWGEGDRVQRQQ